MDSLNYRSFYAACTDIFLRRISMYWMIGPFQLSRARHSRTIFYFFYTKQPEEDSCKWLKSFIFYVQNKKNIKYILILYSHLLQFESMLSGCLMYRHFRSKSRLWMWKMPDGFERRWKELHRHRWGRSWSVVFIMSEFMCIKLNKSQLQRELHLRAI